MAEEKIYLDLEPTAAQVKKGIEEIVEKLTENVVENKDKIFTLEVDTENIPEDFDGALTDDMLDKVKIRLKTVSAISPVEGKLGQMIMSDGNNWIKKSEFYTSLFSNGNSEEGGYTEVRFGPDLIDNPNINGRPVSRLVLSGNPLSLEDKDSSATLSTTRTEQADAKTFKMVIADTAKAIFRNSANVMFRDNANVTFRDDTIFATDSNGIHYSNNEDWDDIRFTLSDGAKVDFNGNWNGKPNFFVHGKINFNMDDGCYIDTDGTQKRHWSGGNKYNDYVSGATVRIHDAALVEMSQSAFLKMGGYGRACIEGSSFLKVDDLANVNFTRNCFFLATDTSQAYFENNSKFHMQGGQFFMNEGLILFNPEHYKPCICINGGGQILFNVDQSIAYGPTGSDYDPCLIANPTSFVFTGQGSTGCELDKWGAYKPGAPIMSFGGPDSLVSTNRNPRIQIADETMIIIDAATGYGSNYLKIGACGGGQTQTHILDNTHLELRQNSVISLRGKSQDSEVGPIGDFPITRHNGPPDGTGSMLTMYDDAVFIMRSEWPEYEESDYENKTDHRGRELTTSTWQPDLDFWRRSGSPLFGMVGNSAFKMQGAATINMNNGSRIDMITGGAITLQSGASINMDLSSQLNITKSSLVNIDTASNINMENGSLINLDNGKISIDEEGVSFSYQDNIITFTFSELEQLKSLISTN
jgi:hypothetical protein